MKDWNEKLKSFVKDAIDCQSFDSLNYEHNQINFAENLLKHKLVIFKIALALNRGDLIVSPEFLDARDGYVSVSGKAKMWDIFE